MIDIANPPPPPRGVVHTAWAKAWEMARTLPALERQAFADSLDALSGIDSANVTTAFCALYKVLYARFRGRKIALNDRHSRTIIGARVSRAFAAQCKWAAESRGLSLNRWAYDALLAALTADLDRVPFDPDIPDIEDDDEGEYSYLL